MALFKIFKGSSDKLYTSEKTKNLVEGYCYFTVDEGKFYIDIASEGDIYKNRICLNAAQADQLREKRTITLTGDAAGSFGFDGSEDVSVEITISELDEINTAISKINTDISGKAPKSHASTGTTYGKGTDTKYGHVKLSDAIDSENTTSNGTAATPKAVKTAYDLANSVNTKAETNATNITQLQEDVKEISTKAPISHASNATTYGVGSGSNYGHLKLSSAINNSSNTDSGTAATPLAVKTAYDLANTANTTANAASTKAASNEGKITELTTSINSLDSNKAPKSHASATATTYGAGTGTNFGHVQLSDSTSSTSGVSSSIAATPKAVKAAYDLANTAKGIADGAASKASSNETKISEINTSINNLNSGKAPTNHASSETTYGTGSADNYGHVKLSASVTDTSGITSGVAATPSAVKSAYDLANTANTKAGTNASDITQLKEDVKGITTKAPINHAVNTNTYGLGTSSVYGHVQLSDSTNSTSSTSSGIAATPKAVKTAYDLANTANTTANTNSGKITTLQSTVNDTLTPAVNNHSNKLQYTNITYGTCSTAAATAAKIIAIDADAKWELKKGSFITVLFSETNTASNPTFNVGGTGAKNVYYTTSQITTKNLSYAGYAGRPMNFVFDGTQYRFAGWGVDSNSDTKVTQNRVTTTDTNTYPVLLKYNTTTANGTSTVKFNESINVTPSTGTLSATKFAGDLDGKAAAAGTSDKVANKFTLKGEEIAAGTFDGSVATSVNIVGAGSTTVKGEVGKITITGATIPTSLKNPNSLTIGSVEYDGSQEQTVESLKNPYALTIQGNGNTLTNGTYDGSAAKTVNITPAAIGALAAGGTAVRATADANGKNIASTYETKANVTSKISDAVSTAKDYTDTEIASLVNGAPEHLNTLKELADALGADDNMSTTIVGMIGGKADKVHTHTDEDIVRSNWPSTNTITGNTLAEMLEDIEGHIDDTVGHIQNSTVHITSDERTKWNKAEVNQNAFSNIAVSGQTTVAADAKTDTVTFAGSNVTITTDATNDKVTFTVANGSTSAKGVVKLEDSISSTSTTTAATPNSVRESYTLANTANTTANSALNKANTNIGTITTLTNTVQNISTVANDAYTTANDALEKANNNIEDIKEVNTLINTLDSNKAPKNHASDKSDYGLGTSSKYGHLKLSDATTDSTLSTSQGTAATPKAVASAYSLADTANTTANIASSKATNNENRISELNSAINGKAEKNHASENTDFGVGNETNYGHLKLSSAVNSELDKNNATAATPKAVKTAYDLANTANNTANTANTQATTNKNNISELNTAVNSKANKKHDSTTDEFGIGTSSAYGHVQLSDSTSSTSAASAGIAATPKAVNTAHTLANTANTTANSNSNKITTLQSTVNDTLTPTVNNHSNKLQYTNITYGTCSTAAATAAKVIAIDTNSKWELKKGSMITILFSETNTASNPTFNVGGTGAKNVYYGASQITTSSLSYAGYENRPMTFIYDGTQYRFASWGYDGNTNTYVTQTVSTSSSSFPILLKNSANSTKETKGANFSAGVTITPSTNTLTATTFSGDLNGKATTAGTADKVANKFTLKGNNTTAGIYDGSEAISVNIIGAGSTTVSGANGTITITGATIPTKLPNAYSLTIGSVEYDGSQAQTVESLKNPYALTIQGNGTTLTNGTYNGSAAKTVNITPTSIGALAANGTAVKATADASGNTITTTYETKSNVTTKISEALNTAKDYTDTSVASLINGAPEHLNTLKELADVLGTDENMSTTIISMIGGKADAVHTHKDSEIIKSSSWAASKITGTTLDAMLSSIDTHMGDAVSHIQDTTAHITAAERTKWNSAEANQNAFSKIKVGTTTIEADNVTDTVTFSGTNISITPTASSDTIAFKVATASTSTAGIVQLEDSRSSTSTTTAATPNSVKAAYDLANDANELANDLNEDVGQLIQDVQDANKHVKQVLSEATTYRPLLLHGVDGGTTEGADPGTITDQVFYNPQIYAQPETGTLFANTFTGDLNGNATTSSGWKSAVTINGSTIQGPDANTSAITTAKWGAARNINIVSSDGTGGSTAVSIDGSSTSGYSLKLPATIKASLTGNVTGNVTGNCSGSSGSCTGNAATATKATQDGSGNTITSTYLKLAGGTMSGNIKIRYTEKGYFLMDKTGYNYPGVYDNGSNLWIGSTATASQHHTGSTYISAGHNGTTGNATIYISVPNDANDGGTNHAVVHAGNYTDYQVNDKVKQGRSGASQWRPLLAHYTYAAAGTDPGTATNQVYYNENIAVQYSTGTLSATKVKGAVWNDYAEYRTYKDSNEDIPYGRIVVENGDDTLSLSTARMQKGGNVCSDTFGFSIGETKSATMPIAVSGRALVYTHEDRNSYTPGDAVCTGPNGTISKMTREEIKEYPDCIIGYVSAIPDYETWGENHTPIDGRIWIKVV